MKTIFLISTKAGSISSDLDSNIRQIYSKANKDVQIYKTQYKDHLRELARSFSDEDCIIYVCGGDGSLNEVASELINKNAILGLIPLGTANDFSKNFRYDNFNIEKTLNPKTMYCDIIKVNDFYSINILSFGLDTIILANTYKILEKFPFLKVNAYLIGILKSIFNFENLDLDIKLNLSDGTVFNIDNSFILGAICNGSYYGGGFNPSPNSNISDGVLELVLAKKMNLFELAKTIPKYKRGTHINHDKIDLYSITGGEINSKSEFLANVDGNIFKSKNIKFDVLKKAIKFATF